MNDELENKELSDLLKQLPAPERLDAARREKILAALPSEKHDAQRAERDARRRIWHGFVKYAAIIVLMLGGVVAVVIPVLKNITIATQYCRRSPQVEAEYEAWSRSRESTTSGAIAYDDGILMECDAPSSEGADLEFSEVSANPFAAQEKHVARSSEVDRTLVLGGAIAEVTDVAGIAPNEAFGSQGFERPTDAESKPLPMSAPVSTPAPPPASSTFSPTPAKMESVAIVKSPIVMRGIVGSRSPGQRGRVLQKWVRTRELPTFQSTVTEEVSGEAVENKIADDETSDWRTSGKLVVKVEADSQEYEVVKPKQKQLASASVISELGTLENSKGQLLDKHGRKSLESDQAALWDRNPGVGSTRFEEANKFYVEKEENLTAIEQAKGGAKDALSQMDSSNERVCVREQMMRDVTKEWASRTYGRDFSEGTEVDSGDKGNNNFNLGTTDEMKILLKMRSITIPEIDFRQANITDVVTFLSEASRENDSQDLPPEERGVNIVLNLGGVADALEAAASVDDPWAAAVAAPVPSSGSVPRLTINARSLTLLSALDMIMDLADLKYRVRDNVVLVMEANKPEGQLVHRMYNVMPTISERVASISGNDGVAGGGAPENPFELSVGTTTETTDWKKFFGDLGIPWPDGSTCQYMSSIGKMVVLNTSKNLSSLEEVLAVLNVTPKQDEEEADSEPPPPPLTFEPFTLIPTAEHPLSTFGLDTDTAGYTRSAMLIASGVRPDPLQIRQEEFINAFEYGDTAPTEAAFRIYLEGARSPFRSANNLLRVGVKGRRLGREEKRSLMLTILLDTSGSMETPERMPLARKAILALLAKLPEGDSVTILTCSDKTRKLFSDSAWDDPETLRSAEKRVTEIRCQGATNLEDGIVRAFESAASEFKPHGENRVVIISDGIANLGSNNASEILKKVAENRGRGIRCWVIGVGRSSYNDTLLEAMANRGDGQYSFLDSEQSIDESFVSDLENSFNTIASDVKIQVEWNREVVEAYKSHGYDSRALRDEQFRDDTVDAGEVGSGQGVTVVYEMKLADSATASAVLGTVRIRYRRTDNGVVEEIEKAITTADVMREFSAARPQFRLACAVAEFATVLKHTPAAAQASALKDVVTIADVVAWNLDYYKPAKAFAETVKRLMALGL